MAKFYGTKLSGSMKRTPEGYLICFGAVIGRTGWQTYKGSELPEDECRDQGITLDATADYKVLRTAEEVFKASALSSFEGKPFTYHHPDELLNVDTINDHQCGHIQNVRKGDEPLENGDWPILADIVVTDKEAIYAIEQAGVRELSCGYNYHILRDGNNLLQVAILGNHVALVENGRAGSLAKIQDSQPRIDMSKITSSFLRALGLRSLAATATPEEFAVAFDAASKDNEHEETHAVDNKHGEGCECKTCKPAAKDMKHGEGCECKSCKPAAADEGDEKQLAGLLAGGAGSLKSKKQPGTAGADGAEEEGRQAGELEVLSEEEEEEGEEEEAHGEDAEFEEGEGAEGEDEAVESEESPEIPAHGRGKTLVPSATDSAYRAGQMHILKILKPIVAQSGNKTAAKAMDSAMKQLTGKSVNGTRGGYSAASRASRTRGKAAMDSVQTAEKRAEEINAEYRKLRGVNTVKK